MNHGERGHILAAVAAYYDAAVARHGPTPQGVDWKDKETQQLRHAQFRRLVENDPKASILDLGCGYGDYLGVLRAQGHQGRYVGCDLAPNMIAAATALHGEGPDRAWHLSEDPPERCDYAIASGLMNVNCDVKGEEWADYVEAIIDTLARSSNRGFGFNMLSLCSDPEKRRPDLYYADPVGTLDLCIRRYGRHVVLLQDYGLWEFTMLIRHSSHTASPKPDIP